MAKKNQERAHIVKKNQERADRAKKNHEIKIINYNDLFLKMISLPRLAAAREIIIESFSVKDEAFLPSGLFKM